MPEFDTREQLLKDAASVRQWPAWMQRLRGVPGEKTMPDTPPAMDLWKLGREAYLTACVKGVRVQYLSPGWQKISRAQKNKWEDIARYVATARDADWQTAMVAQQEALRQARDDFRIYAHHLPDCNALSRWAEDTACSCGVEEALATIEAALEGTHE